MKKRILCFLMLSVLWISSCGKDGAGESGAPLPQDGREAEESGLSPEPSEVWQAGEADSPSDERNQGGAESGSLKDAYEEGSGESASVGKGSEGASGQENSEGDDLDNASDEGGSVDKAGNVQDKGDSVGKGSEGASGQENSEGDHLNNTYGEGSSVDKGDSGNRESEDASGGGNLGYSPAGEGGVKTSGSSADAAMGALSVDGTKLVDGSGNPVQLKGISTHGLAWYPDYVNEECIRQLKEEWGINVFRLAMYTAEYGGYCSGGDKENLKTLVKNGVEYATDNDMYVIIDWHILSDGNPNTYLEDAKDFFGEMSEEYADYTNVFYEICNEPNGGTAWSDVKSYAEQVIEVIRENDGDGIILVGTPNWCQYVEQAAADPIEGYENIMYTLHFYAATHKEDLRDAMVRAVEAGLPVFVSEYGICDASGSGGIDEYQANQWTELLDRYQISYVAWNLSNKSETSAVIKSSCSKVSGFAEEDLSDSGRWLYKMLGAGAESSSGGTIEGSGAPQSGNGDAGGSGTGSGGNGDAGNSGSGSGGNGDAGNSVTRNDENGNEGAQKTPEKQEFEEGGLGIEAQLVNSWGQGDETFYQYTLTITNSTETDMEKWTVQVVFSADVALSNGWNGNYQVDGNVLTITSMDYNGYIGSGGSVDNIGFILQGQAGTEIWIQ